MISQHYSFFHLLLLLLVSNRGVFARDVGGYVYGQSIPVSCLNRTIDSGEHIRDSLGRLQYIPFPTCNETSLPLALRYGVTETISCTIDSLPDELYHLLEYYVHSDAPLTCRVPTVPLSGAGDGEKTSDSSSNPEYQVAAEVVAGDDNNNSNGGPPYTPLTIALQGTLQLSHLHIWTDINVLLHRLSSVESPRKEITTSSSSKKHQVSPGYVVAGTAYSLPELHSPQPDNENRKKTSHSQRKEVEEEDAAMIENARNPWTAGHGSKVIRGEPLTLKFRVSWVSGADSLGWLDQIPPHHREEQQQQPVTVLGVFTKLVFFVMAAGIGALFASYYYQRVVRNGSAGGWRGEGILGRPMRNGGGGGARRGSGVTYGNSGRSNGYGGFAATTTTATTAANGGGYGYGGYGKND